MAKPPPLDRPIAPGRGGNTGLQRPFPVLTPQSYLPGGAGAFPGYGPTGPRSSFPVLGPNSYLQPPGSLEPPIMNFSGGPNLLPAPMPYPPILPQSMGPAISLPPPYPDPNIISIAPQQALYDPGIPSCPRRRTVRVCRRRRRRTRRCRPVIHVIDSSSCSSLSSCSTISSCSRRRRRHRSCSRSRKPAAQPQQPIILLPVPCQQSASAPAPAPIQQQPQQIILPPIQVQHPGQIQPQQLALPGIPLQQQQLALPGIPLQQQQLTIPHIQLNSSGILPSNNSSPVIIASGQPMLQPSLSMPQIAGIGQPQQIHSGVLQYVQAGRQSSSPLQYISAEPRSSIAPHRGLVNSSKKHSTLTKTIPRSASIRDVPQNDLKFGRRPFDWYESDKKKNNNILNENIQIGQRGSTAVR